MQQDFQPNSKRAKEQEAKARTRQDKVIVGGTQQKPPGFFKRMMDTFIVGDIDNLGGYILMNVVIPTVKNAVEDAFLTIWRGESGRRRSGSNASYIPYGSGSRSNREDLRAQRQAQSRPNPEDTTFDTRGDAMEVLERMEEHLERYKRPVTIGDFYDFAGVTDQNWANNNYYGWNDLEKADVFPAGGGRFYIKFPKPMPID